MTSSDEAVLPIARFFLAKIPNLTRTKQGKLTAQIGGKTKYPALDPKGGYSILFGQLSVEDQKALGRTYPDAHFELNHDPALARRVVQAMADLLSGSESDLEKQYREEREAEERRRSEERAAAARRKAEEREAEERRREEEKAAKKRAKAEAKAKASEDALAQVDQLYFNDTITTPLSRLKLIYNLKDRRQSFLYDEVRDILHRYDYDLIMDRLRLVLGEALPAWQMTNSVDCALEYRPLVYPRVSRDEKAEIQIFNTWVDAEWRRDWTPKPNAALAPQIAEFLAAFIPNKGDRTSLLCWLRDACFERAEPILVLCGKPGVGKNLFVENLAGALVGKHNYRSASRGFNRSQFHNNVSNCRLFFLDEMNLTPEARETLKSYHNGVATIERKGKDVGDPEKIWASFAVANNHENKIKLEYTDRKFYVPIISDVPLAASIGQEKPKDLVELLKRPDFVGDFASYLFQNFPAQAAGKFEKNDFFKRLCINSYPLYFRRFLHTIQAMPEVTSRTFSKGSKAIVDVFDLQDNLRHYESQFHERIADLEIHDDGSWTALSLVAPKAGSEVPPAPEDEEEEGKKAPAKNGSEAPGRQLYGAAESPKGGLSL